MKYCMILYFKGYQKDDRSKFKMSTYIYLIVQLKLHCTFLTPLNLKVFQGNLVFLVGNKDILDITLATMKYHNSTHLNVGNKQELHVTVITMKVFTIQLSFYKRMMESSDVKKTHCITTGKIFCSFLFSLFISQC